MDWKRTGRMGAVLTAVVAGLAVPAAAHAGTGLSLPPPTGGYRVGAADLHLIDRHRADPWVPSQRRELMVTLWFPASGGKGTPRPYATPEESRLTLEQIGAPGVPPEALTTVRTYGRTGLSPLPGRRPLVVLSPGFSFPRASLTSLAEDLASRGYLVAGVDHTYEAAAITFPDGRVTSCLVCDLMTAGRTTGEQVSAGRAKDLSFVLTELRRRGLGTGPVAVVGHSIGGSGAAQTMLADRRFDAGANLDGTFFPPVTRRLDRPFLMVEAAEHSAGDTSWPATWSQLTSTSRWIQVDGTTHSSFTDYGILGEQAGLPVQELSGARCAEITRGYVATFLDRTLRHQHRPYPAYPEVTIRP